MILIALFMLLTPGVISARVHWRGREITRDAAPRLICDYFIYSFLIIVFNYAFMFLTFPERGVSFSAVHHGFTSSVYSASFVAKYSLTALVLARALPPALRRARKRFPKL